MKPLVKFFVDGLPETKGSYVGLGRGRVKADNPREKGWAEAVGWTARAAMIGKKLITDPCAVELEFLLPPPHGKKNRRDVDKLTRSVLDAITGIVIADDELVFDLAAMKFVTRMGLHGASVAVGPVDPGYHQLTETDVRELIADAKEIKTWTR